VGHRRAAEALGLQPLHADLPDGSLSLASTRSRRASTS
jgi:hypothetical protein